MDDIRNLIKNTNKSIIELVKSYRNKQLLSQKKISEILGFSSNRYADIERGKNFDLENGFTVANLVRFSNYSGIPLTEIFNNTEREEDSNQPQLIDRLERIPKGDFEYLQNALIKSEQSDINYLVNILTLLLKLDEKQKKNVFLIIYKEFIKSDKYDSKNDRKIADEVIKLTKEIIY